MPQYLYRTDLLHKLRAQENDPWLRARRIQEQTPPFRHWQIEEAVGDAGPGCGVFALWIWRTLDRPLEYLHSDAEVFSSMGPDWDRLSMVQRIRADHPFFRQYRRGDDQHESGNGWLFWNTAVCAEDQEWSADGIPHTDIEMFHPDGYWAPFDQVLQTPAKPPAPLPGWTRFILAPAYGGPTERAVDARWVDHPSLGRCVFARVPVWSQSVSPKEYPNRRLLEVRLFEAFPELTIAGRLIVVQERTGYMETFDIPVARTTAISAASLLDAEAVMPRDGLAESLYRAAGIDPESLGASAFAYGPDALALLEREAATEGASQARERNFLGTQDQALASR